VRKLCIINQKGGVGKTTTAVNLAAGLSRQERNVLLIDMDPQGNVADSLPTTAKFSLYDFLVGNCEYTDCIENLGKNLDVIRSNESLTKIGVYLANHPKPTLAFKKKFLDITNYDYIIMDCAPSLGLLNQNVMVYSDEAIIPVSTNFLSLTGLAVMAEAIREINRHYNHTLKISLIVPTMHDARNKSNKEMLKRLHKQHVGLVCDPIRINAKLAEAPEHKKSIFSYDSKSRGAEDYAKLTQTILAKEKRIETETVPISMRVQKIMADVQAEE
jgi:chromosome partitioning protein